MNLYEKIKSDVYIIAEMSANHAGKLENALKIIEEAKQAGADCIKIQTYTPDTLTINCKKDPYRIKGGLWDGYYYYQLYQEACTPWEWHKAMKEQCERIGIDFLSTPFDITSVDYLEEMEMEFYKIASPELVDIPLISYVAGKGKPLIISCGMGSIEEIEEVLQVCKEQNNEQVVLLKCCSQYPAKFEDMNISVIGDMIKRFGKPVGLSDHSEGSLASVAAVSLGAKVIEKHICLNHKIETPDAKFSMDIEEFAKMVEDVRNTVVIMGTSSYEVTQGEKNSLYNRRSLVAVKPIKKGEIFSEENVRSIRPAIGIKPKYYKQLLGKKAKKEYCFGEPILGSEIDIFES